jgi:hypothetical protein
MLGAGAAASHDAGRKQRRENKKDVGEESHAEREA